jgi:hypothetical protein
MTPHCEGGTRWGDDGAERVAMLLDEVQLNGAKLGFQGGDVSFLRPCME